MSTSPSSPLRQRVVTGVIGAALAVGGILALPSGWVFLVVFVIVTWAAVEFVDIGLALAPTAPLKSLWLWIPLAQLAGFFFLRSDTEVSPIAVLLPIYVTVMLASLASLFAKADMRDRALGMALMAFAIPYFALGTLGCYLAHRADRWWLFLLLAIVALGDTLAYFTGKRFGRHKLAPSVSPKKTWEGSVGGFAGSLLATAVWSHWVLDRIDPALMLVAAATAIMAQAGDLVESVVKRGAGVKDSSQILPGHGGFYDRLDAMILGAPTFVIGLWLAGFPI